MKLSRALASALDAMQVIHDLPENILIGGKALAKRLDEPYPTLKRTMMLLTRNGILIGEAGQYATYRKGPLFEEVTVGQLAEIFNHDFNASELVPQSRASERVKAALRNCLGVRCVLLFR